jgi:hypothetical protein
VKSLALTLCLAAGAAQAAPPTVNIPQGFLQSFTVPVQGGVFDVPLGQEADGTFRYLQTTGGALQTSGTLNQGTGSSSNPWYFQGLGTFGAPTGGVVSVQGSTTGLPVIQAGVTPAAGTNAVITTGGTAVTLVTGPVNGGYICNPLTASDQNISTAEVAYVNPVTTATANGRGTNSALQPGQCFTVPPLKTGSNVSGIAATSSHALNVVVQ